MVNIIMLLIVRFDVVTYPVLVVVVFGSLLMAANRPPAQYPREQRPPDSDDRDEKDDKSHSVFLVYEHGQADSCKQHQGQYEIASSSIHRIPFDLIRCIHMIVLNRY